MVAAALKDEHAADVLGRFLAARQAAARDVLDRAVRRGELADARGAQSVTDVLGGTLWWALVVRQETWSPARARRLVSALVAAAAG